MYEPTTNAQQILYLWTCFLERFPEAAPRYDAEGHFTGVFVNGSLRDVSYRPTRFWELQDSYRRVEDACEVLMRMGAIQRDGQQTGKAEGDGDDPYAPFRRLFGQAKYGER